MPFVPLGAGPLAPLLPYTAIFFSGVSFASVGNHYISHHRTVLQDVLQCSEHTIDRHAQCKWIHHGWGWHYQPPTVCSHVRAPHHPALHPTSACAACRTCHTMPFLSTVATATTLHAYRSQIMQHSKIFAHKTAVVIKGSNRCRTGAYVQCSQLQSNRAANCDCGEQRNDSRPRITATNPRRRQIRGASGDTSCTAVDCAMCIAHRRMCHAMVVVYRRRWWWWWW